MLLDQVAGSLAYWEMSSGRNGVLALHDEAESLAYWEMSSGRNEPNIRR